MSNNITISDVAEALGVDVYKRQAYDHKFIYGRNIYDNISLIVNEMFENLSLIHI